MKARSVLRLKFLPHADGLRKPSYQTSGASGMDIEAAVAAFEPVILKPFDRAVIVTGLLLELATGYEGQIRPRSGLAARYGVTVLNTPGTIDQDYRGELKILLINMGAESFTVKRGMRIAQLVIAPILRVEPEIVDRLSESDRGSEGFGSTGFL
ncbi:MAG: dUTP diphosphatase [Alphaproteobacteria bacterium]|nr:dUTP diphosphatase [Alphaproteobacteria bacterium]